MSAKTSKIVDKVRDIVLEFKEDYISIYHIEYVKEFGNYFLRIFIDKDGGVSIDDCENLSRSISDKLDEIEDSMSDNYILEVCSPGIDRQLHTDEHYRDAIGEEIYVKTIVKIEGKKEHIGILKSLDEKEIILECENDTYTILRDKITKANIYFA